MTRRSNEQWLQVLKEPGEQQLEALEALRDYLLRAILVYLHKHRSDLANWSSTDIHNFAEDMAQDALLAIRQKLDTFRGDSKFTTWAYRFAINVTAGELRRSRYRDLSLEGMQEQEAMFLTDVFRDTQNVEPGVTVERRAFVDLLGRIIREELTERQRLAILGVHFQERSMQEVAEKMGINRNALYKLLHDARKRIKSQLQARYISPGDVLALFESES